MEHMPNICHRPSYPLDICVVLCRMTLQLMSAWVAARSRFQSLY